MVLMNPIDGNSAGNSPEVITVGAYVNQIYGISLKENKLTVDFYLWFRYRSKDVHPLDSFEIMNGRIESKTVVEKKFINGVRYEACRIIATLNKFWDCLQISVR